MAECAKTNPGERDCRIRQLFAQYRSSDTETSQRAKEDLIAENGGLINFLIDKSYSSYKAKHQEDLFQVGAYGMLLSFRTFDPDKGTFSTHAAHYIEHELHDYITTFVNGNQKVNDKLGNPVEVSAIVVWKVVDATKAVINVDNYVDYLSSQTDSTIRNVARLYPYDLMSDDDDTNDDADETTLRGSAVQVAEQMKAELARRVENAGIEIVEVRLNQIAYATEIAAAMLQKQQAVAIIAARKKIVEGAVSMVEMALDKLKSDGVVDLDEERKAQMVSNLLVVLCGNKEANPVLNTGSIY